MSLVVSDSGPAIVDYVGHGGPGVWGREGFFYPPDTDRLTNAGRPSVYIATSCLSGYFVHPQQEGLGEQLVDATSGGAIAVLTSSALETLHPGQEINAVFLRELYAGSTFGDAAVTAKRDARSPGDSAFMLLFGDPAMRLR